MLTLVYAPDPVLKKMALPLPEVDDRVRRHLDEMLDVMYESDGIGLAAPQVGLSQRMLVMDLAASSVGKTKVTPQPIQMVNPEIIWSSAELADYEEGCLSFPEQYITITRPAEVTVRYWDRAGDIQELKASGLQAVCVQHEIDHLNGVVFVDYISRLRRELLMRKLRKIVEERKSKR